MRKHRQRRRQWHPRRTWKVPELAAQWARRSSQGLPKCARRSRSAWALLCERACRRPCPTDEQQAGQEAHTLLAGTLPLGVGEGVGPGSPRRNPIITFFSASTASMQRRTRCCASAPDTRVSKRTYETSSLGPFRGRDVAGGERIAFLGLHFADAIEIPGPVMCRSK